MACGEAPSRIGLIFMTDNEQDKRWPDIGTVLACHPSDGLVAGQVVVMEPYAGTIVADAHGYPYVRYLGVERNEWIPEPVDLDEHIVAVMEGKTLTPYKRRILIEMSAAEEKFGEILLPSSAVRRDNEAKVLEVGSEVSNVRPGDRVMIYRSNAVRVELGKDFEESYGVEPGTLAFVFESDIYGFVE